MATTWRMPGPDASPREVAYALRTRALSFTVFAEALACRDKSGAAVAREEAVQLRCQAAVIEELSELYDELGVQAQRWGEFAERLRGTT